MTALPFFTLLFLKILKIVTTFVIFTISNIVFNNSSINFKFNSNFIYIIISFFFNLHFYQIFLQIYHRLNIVYFKKIFNILKLISIVKTLLI